MAEYEKQVWNCGDTITADKMNHIEEGIEAASSGGALMVNVVDTDPALSAQTLNTPLLRDTQPGEWLDKTWQEIYNAFPMVYIKRNENGDERMTSVFEVGSYSEPASYIVATDSRYSETFSTDTPNGYPSFGSVVKP